MRRRIVQFARSLPLKRKLALVTLVTCGAALILSCAVLFWFQTRTFRNEFIGELESLARIVARNSAAPLAARDRQSIGQVLAACAVNSYVKTAWLLDEQRKFFAGYRTGAARHDAPGGIEGVRFENDVVLLKMPIVFEGTRIGWLCVEADFREKYRELLSIYALVMAGVIAGALIIILVFSSLLQRLIAGPIISLAQIAHRIGENEDFSVRAPPKGTDEVGLLTQAFNRMLDQIESRDARLRLINTSLEREVLERTKAETELRESRERYEVAIAGSNDGIWDWKIEANEFFFSSRWKEMLGYLDQELPNTREMWERLIHPEDKPAVLQALDQYLGNKRASFEQEFRMQHKAGGCRWIYCRGSALREANGKAVRLAGSQSDITRRKEAETELAQLNRRLQDASRKAGMAEVATGVLHNVGNVLNSVSVITVTLQDDFEKSRLGALTRTSGLIRENLPNIGPYLTEDPKGRLVPDFLLMLTDELARERAVAISRVKELAIGVEHIKEIVAMQQSIAKISGVIEPLPAPELVEDALRIHAAALEQDPIQIEKHFETVPHVMADRHKVLQILLNLLRNAKYAMDESENRPKALTLAIHRARAGYVTIECKDNGLGIAPENLTRIFSHGFTTKKDGHGFGLHSGANAAREMGGRLSAQSDGPGRGATFSLDLPTSEPESKNAI